MIGTDSAYEFHRMTKYLHISQIVLTALWLALLLALKLALGVAGSPAGSPAGMLTGFGILNV